MEDIIIRVVNYFLNKIYDRQDEDFEKNNEPSYYSFVRHPKRNLVIAVIAFLACAAMTVGAILFNSGETSDYVFLVMCLVLLPALIYNIFECKTFKIEFDNDGFSYRKNFRKSVYYKYADIEKITLSQFMIRKQLTLVFNNGKKIYIDQRDYGSARLVEIIRLKADVDWCNSNGAIIASEKDKSFVRIRNTESSRTVRLNISLFICGIVIILIACIVVFFSVKYFKGFMYILLPIAIIIFMFGMYRLEKYFEFKLEYNNEYFSYSDFVGEKYLYSYSDIFNYEVSDKGLVLYMKNGPKIIVNYNYYGGKRFSDYAVFKFRDLNR